MNHFLDHMVSTTEGFLTWRARRKWKRKNKKKNLVLSWIEAFVWSACVILLVNQYLVQAYVIPSSSMENTLLVQDRIFVNKFIYGPEILPNFGKLPGLKTPKRGEVIIFESPKYASKGPIFDVLQRLIYMLTFSLVDIDRGEDGNMQVHLMIKRGVGVGGDVVRFRRGEAEFLPAGEKRWMSEEELKHATGLTYQQNRRHPKLHSQYYTHLPLAEKGRAHEVLGLDKTDEEQKAEEALFAFYRQNKLGQFQDFYPDRQESERLYSRFILEIKQHDIHTLSRFTRLENGQYIPEKAILPLGDNRDNSHDGRFFGPVSEDKILGQAALRYWPLNERLGEIR